MPNSIGPNVPSSNIFLQRNGLTNLNETQVKNQLKALKTKLANDIKKFSKRLSTEDKITEVLSEESQNTQPAVSDEPTLSAKQLEIIAKNLDQVPDIKGMGLLGLKETCRSHRVHLLMTDTGSKLSAYWETESDDSSIKMISELNKVLHQILDGLKYEGYKKDDSLENDFYKKLEDANQTAVSHLKITQKKRFKADDEAGRKKNDNLENALHNFKSIAADLLRNRK